MMSAEEDQVNVEHLPIGVSNGEPQKQQDNVAAVVSASKVLLETAIIDDDEVAATVAVKSTAGAMSDVPVDFISSYNTICGDQVADGPLKEALTKLTSPKVQEKLTSVYTDACELWSYASEYDYSPQVPYNGFRTLLKVIFSYFDHLSLYLRLIKFHEIPAKQKDKLIKRMQDFVDFLPLLTHQLERVKMIRKQTSQNSSLWQVTDDSLQTELMIVHNEMQLTQKDMINFFKKSVYGFWLPESIRKCVRKLRKRTICVIYPWTQGLGALFSEEKCAKLLADTAVNWSYAEMKKVLEKMPKMKPTADVTVTKFNLEKRQYRWIVDREASSVLENLGNESSGSAGVSAVRLQIIKPKLKQTDRVILQLHGGGWATGSVELCYPWLCQWAKEIGATIVAVDYSLAPAHKYPTALQEILDTYLWLSSAVSSATVLEPLGFVPHDIVVTGDSAGGNLTVALAILLAEITKKSSDAPKLPRALVPMYPAASPGTPFITASSTLFDILLTPLQRSKMGIYYYSDNPADPAISYLNGKNNPWFADQVKYKDAYTRINGHKRGDPLFHLLTYGSYDLLKQVPLYVQAAEFDPLLDDALHVAQVWKGQVILDVMPNVVHGYLMFDKLSPECGRACEATLARLKEAIGK